jgi:hypothetical protein
MSITTNIQSLTATDILSNFFKGKGQFMRAAWKSNPKPSAAFKGTVLEKRTTTIIRSGLEFQNLTSVKEAIESGERSAEIGPLPFGEWAYYPYLIKYEKEGNTNYYLRMYPTDSIPIVRYFVNDAEVKKDEFAKYLTPSEAKKLLSEDKEKPECFTIKMENVLSTEEVVD